MARILFVWELGKGFGHLAPYIDLVDGLQKRGHQVVFATRDVGNTEKLFGSKGVVALQAPIMMHNVANPYRVQYNFSHLLHNIGFAEARSIFGLVKAWRHIYKYSQPDLALFDHSPTALLAAKPYKFKRIVSGSGFLIPPAARPLPLMRYWQQYDMDRLAKEEAQLLATINRIQEGFKLPPLKSVAEIYDADRQFLLSFQELDHYPNRPNGNYVGMFSPPEHGVAPAWPGNAPRRIFAYLHPFRQIGELLGVLAKENFSVIVYGPEIPDTVKKKAQSERLVFSAQPLDIRKVAEDCNFAVTNGTFGTTAAFLLYGKPVLAVPTNLERVMVARRLVAVGAGLAVRPDKTENLSKAINNLLSSGKFREAAKTFGSRYAHLSQQWQTEQMLAAVDELLGGAPVPRREASAPPAGADSPPASQRKSRRARHK
jgi:UDP:flavonoid glycosyltransferase YjiC (YdhE family)